MKIIIIANYTEDKGGISGVVFNHFKKLTEEGHTVQIFSTYRSQLTRIFLFFLLMVKVRKYDVVHIHGCSGRGFLPVVIGILSAKVFNKRKTIVTYHGGGAEDFLKKRKKLIKWFLGKADYITVMSGFLQDVFKRFDIDTVILKNVIDIDIDTKISSGFSTPKLLSIRGLSKIYNINDIIEAFKIVKKKYPTASLKIAGTGEEQENLVKLVAGCEQIEFLGKLPSSKMSELMKENNIFISVPSFDNQPMSILEAFASGIIIIASNVGGVPYMIENGRNGLLVDVNSPEQIVEKIDWIIENPESAIQIVEEGKKEVEKYLWKNIRQTLIGFYLNLSKS